MEESRNFATPTLSVQQRKSLSVNNGNPTALQGLLDAVSAPSGYESMPPAAPGTPPPISSGQARWGLLKDHVMQKELFVHQRPAADKLVDVVRTRYGYNLTLRECLLLFLVLLGIGAFAYSFVFERWSILDSLYFTTVLLTTVGYGDLTPITTGGKLFASAFALVGIVVLGLVMGVVGSQLVEAELGYSEKLQANTASVLEEAFSWGTRHQRSRRSRWTALRETMLSPSASEETDEGADPAGLCGARRDPDPPVAPPCDKKERHCVPGQRHLPALVPMLAAGAITAHVAHRGWCDGIYYCVVTATTIGFGDLTPESPIARGCAILFIPLGVAAMAYILSNVAAFIIEQRRAHYTQDLAAYQLKIEDLEALDEAHDGGVSELEYVKFMLVAMNKCDGALFDDLRDQFHRLDMTGDGQITKNDLKIMVTKKMKKVSNKLILHQYKSWLQHRESKALFRSVSRKV